MAIEVYLLPSDQSTQVYPLNPILEGRTRTYLDHSTQPPTKFRVANLAGRGVMTATSFTEEPLAEIAAGDSLDVQITGPSHRLIRLIFIAASVSKNVN